MTPDQDPEPSVACGIGSSASAAESGRVTAPTEALGDAGMVERVAMALATARAGREAAEVSRFQAGNLWVDARRDARAAIEAMREPTEAMKAAGRLMHPMYDDPITPPEDYWAAMIDAALQPMKERE